MKRLTYALVILAILIPTLTVRVGADDADYSPKIKQQVIQDCAVIKTTLNNLRKRDISTRVAHVYINEFLLERTKAFSLRLSNNDIDYTAIDADNETIESQLNSFKSSYDKYDDSLSDLRAIDCKASPREFYDQLQATRAERIILRKNLASLDASWDKFVKSIETIDISQIDDSQNVGGAND